MVEKLGVVIQSRDGAAVGLRRCIDLAGRVGGSVHLIDVTEPRPGWLQRARRNSPSETDRLRQRRTLAQRFVSNVRAGDVEVSVAVRSGRRIVELISEILDAGVDVVAIVAGDTEPSSTFEAFAGRVVRKSPVPVLVLRPPGSGGSGTVVAVDVSAADGSDVLIDSILTLGATLTPPGDPIAVVHVLVLPDDAASSRAEVDELARSETDVARARLEALVAKTGLPGDTSVEVRVGRAVDEIAAVVGERRLELLVVGTVSRSGPAGLMIGNTADAVLREVGCSVLAVKPPGFRSPLE